MVDNSFAVFDFLVVFPLWLIAPDPPPTHSLAHLKRLVVVTLTRDGEPVSYIPAFTDRDLAERFANQMVKSDGDRVASAFIQIPDRIYLEELLAILPAFGYTHFSFDPEPHRDIPIPIAAVLAAIREPSTL
jgi:hypothetical protein